jgi:hypothetical protein
MSFSRLALLCTWRPSVCLFLVLGAASRVARWSYFSTSIVLGALWAHIMYAVLVLLSHHRQPCVTIISCFAWGVKWFLVFLLARVTACRWSAAIWHAGTGVAPGCCWRWS